MWRMWVLTVWTETLELGGDLGRLQVAGQVPEDAQLGVAELLQHGAGSPCRGGGDDPASTSRMSASSVAWAVRCREWRSSSSATGASDERQDDPVRLGELERPLDRGLRGARVTELVLGDGVEQGAPG